MILGIVLAVAVLAASGRDTPGEHQVSPDGAPLADQLAARAESASPRPGHDPGK